MKKLILISLLLFATTGLIEKDGVDDVKIGMDVSKFLAMKNNMYSIQKEVLTLEGTDSPIYNAYEDSVKVFAVEPDGYEKKVERIWVYGEKFKTENGIGVGNTLGDLSKKYTLVESATAEGSVAVFVKEIDISFVLDTDYIKSDWWNDRKLENLKKNIPIALIII